MWPLLVAGIHTCSPHKSHDMIRSAVSVTSTINPVLSCCPPSQPLAHVPLQLKDFLRPQWQQAQKRCFASQHQPVDDGYSVQRIQSRKAAAARRKSKGAFVDEKNKAIDSIFITSTNRFLHAPLGSFDSRAWNEARWTLLWRLKETTIESVRLAFQIMDRCIAEYEYGNYGDHKKHTSVPTVLSTEMLNAVINYWRLGAKRMKSINDRSQLPTPTNILKRINQYYERNQGHFLLPLQPNIQTYSMVLDALAFGQPDVVVEPVYQRMTPLHQSKSTGSSSESAWDNIQAPFVAESVLEWLIEQSKHNSSLEPTIVTINSVIHAWARSGFPDAAENAEAWLRRIISSSDNDLAPTAATYGSVIYAWSNSNAPDAAMRAGTLLQEMLNSGLPHLKPDSVIYVGVLKTYGRARTKDAAEQANDILQTLVQKYLEEHEKMDKSGDNRISTAKPDLTTFLVVMNAFARQGNAQRASDLLDQLQNLYETSGGDPDFFPNAAAFNCVLKACSKCKSKGAAIQATNVLRRMYTLAETSGTKGLLPDAISYNTVLHAFANTGGHDALERVEEILHTMFETQGVTPNLYSFNSVLHCWAQSHRDDAAEKAEGILRRMWQLYHGGQTDFRPDVVSYNTCIDAWSKSKHKHATHRAEALFRELHRHYQESGDRNLQPTRISYGSLITAWSREKRNGGGAKAERIFDEMVESGIIPTQIEYNVTIHAAAVNGEPVRAEALLDRMFHDFMGGNAKAKPDVWSFSGVLNSFAKVRSKDTFSDAQRAESFLLRMEELREVLGDEVKPNFISFNTVLTCFAKCNGNLTAAVHAEKLLRHMQALYEAGNADVKPTAVSFTIVMNSWVRSQAPDAAVRAETLFRELKELYASTNDSLLKPTLHTYTALLTAYAKCTMEESLGKALTVFEELVGDYKESGDLNLRPCPIHYSAIINAYAKRGMAKEAETFLQRILGDRDGLEVSGDLTTSFNALIGAYARSHEPHSGEKAEEMLRRMYKMLPYSTPGQRIFAVPNVISYTSVMLAWSRAKCQDERDAGVERCEALLNEMLSLAERGDPHIMPTQITFGTFLEVIFHSSAEDKAERAQQTFVTMKQCGVHPDDYVMGLVHKCCSNLNWNG